MKKNNKGFMIIEILIVSTVVIGVLVFMYAQFKNLNTSFNQTTKYNTVQSIYKTNEIKKLIENDATLIMIEQLSKSQTKYLDITSCSIENYNSVSFCKLLYEKLGVDSILLLTEDVTEVTSTSMTNLSQGMKNFLNYIKKNYTGNYYRIVVSYSDGTYGTLRINVLRTSFDFSYTGDIQIFTVPVDGYYKVELWGASGAGTYGGKGAYTSGTIYLSKDTVFYLNVGNNPATGETAFNGGGAPGNTSGNGGGGATDVRLEQNNLLSRIMVAAGGGGMGVGRNQNCGAGYGGTLIGGDSLITASEQATVDAGTSPTPISTGATQILGGVGGQWYSNLAGLNGAFGIGGNGQASTTVILRSGPGGGGGYYGGASGTLCGSTACSFSASGGSSFVSGYAGCDAISETSTSDNIIHTGQSVHYSGYKFDYSEMIAGNEIMPNYEGGTMTGNTGNGYARISIVSE